MGTTTDTVLLTGEEILIFAITRGFTPPALLADLDVVRLSGDALMQRLIEAGRVLVTRGVEINPPGPGDEPGSLESLLAAVCDASAEMIAVAFQGDLVRQRRFAWRDGTLVEQAWNDGGIHAVREIDRAQLLEQLNQAAGNPARTNGVRNTHFTLRSEELSSAASDGPAGLAAFLARALNIAGQSDEVSGTLAEAMMNGRRSAVSVRTASGEVTVLTWVDGGGAGLWSYGPDSDADDAGITFNRLSGADLHEALNRLCDLFAATLA